MKEYLQLAKHVLDHGVVKQDRTGTGTKSIFGYQARYDLSKGFPLVTTKKVHWKSVVHELLWMISGDTNIKYLNDNGVHIWDEWANSNGELGPVYGAQWRHWSGIDQLRATVNRLKYDPNSRRHIVSAWNVGAISEMALPPCHMMFQFYMYNGVLSCQMYQRSADIFLGVPFNIASYSLLTHMIAHLINAEVGEFIHTIGDAHIYLNHIDQVKEQLTREPKSLPTLRFARTITDIDDFKFEDIILEGYEPHPAIKGEVSV